MQFLYFSLFVALSMWACLPTALAQSKKQIEAIETKLRQNLSPLQKAQTLQKASMMLNEIDLPKATQYAQEAFEITQNYPNTVEQADSYYALACIDRLKERFEACNQKLAIAYKIFGKANDELNMHKILTEQAICYSNKSQKTKADSLFEICDTFFETKYSNSLWKGVYLHYMGIHTLRKGKLHESIEYFQRAAIIYEALGENMRYARIQNGIGLAYKNLNFTRLALEYYLKSLKIYEKEGLPYKGKTITLMNVGNMYILLGDSTNFRVAKRYYQEAKNLAESQKNYLDVVNVLEGMGKISYTQANYQQALAYFDSALVIIQKHDFRLKKAYINLEKALAYTRLKKYEISEKEAMESLKIFEKEKITKNIMECLLLLGNIKLAQNNFQKALYYYKKAEEKAIETQNSIFLIGAWQHLSQNYLLMQDCEKAWEYAQKAHEECATNKLVVYLATAYRLLASSDSCKGNFDKAFDWFNKYVILKDSLDTKTKLMNTYEIQAVYDFEKQQKTNEILKKDNLLKEYRLSQRSLWLLFLSISLFFAIVLAATLFYFYRFQRIKNHQIQVKNQELQEGNTFKTKLISIIAHDLRRPYVNFLGTLQLLRTGDLDRDEQDYLFAEIEKQTSNTQDFINSLLLWAKSQAKGFIYKPIEFDCFIVAMSVSAFLETQAKEKNISIKNEIPYESFVFADMEILKIIILNLCANAIKFSHTDGNITLKFVKDRRKKTIIVEDKGVGISVENQQKILKGASFYTSGTKEESGFGLGLMICYDLAERMKAQLAFESEVGKGTTFRLTLRG